MQKNELENVVEVTKSLVHDYYAGEYGAWFQHLDSKSVWISSHTPMLIGAKCIREYFEESGADVENMDAEELEEASEVFPLSGGRYLIVEG